jgi:hypothetical protein
MSVIPELRVGSTFWKISIVRLMAKPHAVAAAAGRLLLVTDDKYQQTRNPNGMNPTMFIPASFQ